MTSQAILENIKFKYPLTFKEDTHQYFLGNQECDSVSRVLESMKKPFNAKEMSEYCSQKTTHEHYGKCPKLIRDIWTQTNIIACDKGHIFHNYAEWWIKLSFAQEYFEYEQDLSQRITTLMDSNPHLETYFAAFNEFFAENIWKKGLQIVATEVQIVSPTYKIGGTFDALFMYQGLLFIFDWKTNSKFEVASKYKLLAPYTKFDCSDLTIYTFQVHLYKWILEKEYGIEVKGARIIHFSENGKFTVHQPKFAYNARFMESVLQRFRNAKNLKAA